MVLNLIFTLYCSHFSWQHNTLHLPCKWLFRSHYFSAIFFSLLVKAHRHVVIYQWEWTCTKTVLTLQPVQAWIYLSAKFFNSFLSSCPYTFIQNGTSIFVFPFSKFTDNSLYIDMPAATFLPYSDLGPTIHAEGKRFIKGDEK